MEACASLNYLITIIFEWHISASTAQSFLSVLQKLTLLFPLKLAYHHQQTLNSPLHNLGLVLQCGL